MHLQENTVFDIDLGVKATHDVAQHPLHYVIYAFAKFDVASFNGKGDAITRKYSFGRDLDVKVKQYVAQYHLRHLIYAHVQFEVATSNG